ncbi:phytanoyl-CoA dioxygenase family protein [Sphingomonas sp. LaA6.9]|uniref:phytanoyl-CoA dioxygenase family protein n=1 Tax=Sphingomonas sp. LaA6.9 TaxID=2919914 RepID=UPI001F4FC550|nr:phytanoyl-CoA dioxygenase family protein [Sphingomonas sp. LaA6.9]MCJ8159901.1 phytanoyl-CoA dioxygenase family protein [Sphingomonas sp. LaA6.9]
MIDLDIPDFDSAADAIISDLAPVYDDTCRIENAWRRCPEVRQLATSPQILDTLAHLYGRKAFAFQTLNFNRGTQQATHSDTIHFDSNPAGFMAGVWVALEDIDANNGPLRYYPGSQKLPHATLNDFGVDRLDGHDTYLLYRSVYEPGIESIVQEQGFIAEEAHLKRGQALIWSANLLHGGQPILDPARTRHSQVTHYYFEDCGYFTPLLSDEERGLFRRYPVDIKTGRNVGGSANGKKIKVPMTQRIKSAAKNVLRSGTRYKR